jgi:hypothetical protein
MRLRRRLSDQQPISNILAKEQRNEPGHGLIFGIHRNPAECEEIPAKVGFSSAFSPFFVQQLNTAAAKVHPVAVSGQWYKGAARSDRSAARAAQDRKMDRQDVRAETNQLTRTGPVPVPQ